MSSNEEYTLVFSTTMEGLIEQVNTKLDEGWKLQGGVSIGVSCKANAMMQAMYREKVRVTESNLIKPAVVSEADVEYKSK